MFSQHGVALANRNSAGEDFSELEARLRDAERPLAAGGECRTTAGECRTAAGVIAVTIPEVVSSHNKPIQEIAGPFDART
jgi:hypothetical protein